MIIAVSPSNLSDSAALSANRHNELTRQQQDAFVHTSTHGIGAWIGLPVALVIIAPVAVRYGDQVENLQGAAQALPLAFVLVTIIVCVIIFNRLVAIPARLYINRAHVESKSGQVTFENQQYRIMVGKRQLRSVYGSGMDLLPGSYTFYTIGGTRWLVAAEKEADEISGSLAMSDRAAEKVTLQYDIQELRRALALTLGFDQAALEANRQGRLTSRQIQTLKQSGGSNFRDAIFFMLIGVVIVALSLLVHIALSVEALIGVLIIFGGTGTYLYFKARSESADVRHARVEMSEGTARKSEERADGEHQYHYYYFIKGVRLEVSKAAYEALIEHAVYRVYYAPVSKQIMSIEPVE